eukprot:Skav208332  [mRNA]  locus=scaffold1961:246732:249139:+ [translate_table: standard]
MGKPAERFSQFENSEPLVNCHSSGSNGCWGALPASEAGALEALTAALSCHEDLRLSSAAGCAGLQICGGSDDASDASAARKRKQKALEARGAVGFSQLLPSLLVLQHLALALNTDDLEMRRRAAWALSEMLQFSDETLPQREALSSAIASRDPELQRGFASDARAGSTS